MYVRVAVARYDPAREDEVGRFADDEVVASYRAQPGFHGYRGGRDREAGRLVAITTWDTREHAQRRPEFTAQIRPRFAELGIALESEQIFELTAQG
ncbi:MAG TPA: antibiotic biosynthesis monooxygenase [Thermomicrobiales bacterium]|nr:antibiotic biosynthesis monooxygenase [Thermomicrobiales bacterium]